MSFRPLAQLLWLSALSALFIACGHKESGPPPHYAVVGFENLSGDSSLDWVSLGAGEFLSRSLVGAVGSSAGNSGAVLSPDAIARSSQSLGEHPGNVPGVSSARSGAIVAGASLIIAGYVEKTPGGVRITASEENVVTHQTVRTLAATSSSPFVALNLLAHQFSDKAGLPPTNNAEAFQFYSTALGSSASAAPPLLERAVALDPAFGRAWITLARTYVLLHDRSGALGAIERARAQNIAPRAQNIAPIDRAWLDFEEAALDGDRTARLAAMRKVSELDSGDTALARNLAETETALGNFSQSAAVWKKLTVNDPGNANAWNQLGYTLCWSGDYAGALAALREYARLRPAEANPLDSQGDVHYWFGKFADAAASYSAANAKMPGFLNGGDLYKGAWAKFLAGDKTGADALFGKLRAAREKDNDPSIDILAGDWLYRTGRPKEAFELLREVLKKEGAKKEGVTESPAIRPAVAAYLAAWDLLAGDRAAAAIDLADGGASAATPGELLVRFAATPSAPVSEWEARADRLSASPSLAGLRPTALGYALILDGKKQAAIPVWEEIVKQSPANDFFPRAILARLKGQPVEHNAAPDPANPNPFAALPGKL